MALFNVPKRPGKSADLKAAKKSKTAKKSAGTVKAGNSILTKIANIKTLVEKTLGHLKDKYIILDTPPKLQEFLLKCADNKIISIDTETTGLDPLVDKIVGLCLYTTNQSAAYVPINHTSYVTGVRADNQLTEKEVSVELEKLLTTKPFIIMHNSKFDIRVIRNQLKVSDIYCDWDCLLAARLLNENEPTNRLKKLHQKYVLNNSEDEFTFDEFFKGVSFDKIPINTAYLYAAHDAEITYELYEFQKQYLNPDSDRKDMRDIYWVFKNIEMPCVEPVCEMEDNGIEFDFNKHRELSEKYHKLLEEQEKKCYKEIDKYSDKIAEYKKSNPNCKLENPVNLSSPLQIAILLYDVLGLDNRDTKNPRGTGSDILAKLNNPIAESLIKYREFSKLVDAFIDSLPKFVNKSDGRIHCSFNQYGAKTGRMSCSDPNLQQIPSHNKEIRQMFRASDGYVLMSSDFSQQEPKALAALCRKQGDSQMYDTFMQGKDLYSEIASKAFNVSYEDCLEFNADGSTNKEGKSRRTQAKAILLGILYGRGVSSIAEQLHCSVEKAQQIKDSVFKGFPAIEKFEQDSLQMAKELGYVTTVCGRKRRLYDIQLPEFEFEWADGKHYDSDVLDFDEDLNEIPVNQNLINKYTRQLKRARFSEKKRIIQSALKDNVKIKDNGGKIADATRQCVNARIQGSAASLTKLAMIELYNSKRLKDLGFRLLIPVHDEIIAECPKENVKECSKLLAETMSKAAERILEMPIKCDVSLSNCWYGNEIFLDN